MASEDPQKMSLNDLMGRMGQAGRDSINGVKLAAEYERRKFVLQRVAVIIAGTGVVIAFIGVSVAAAHLAHLLGIL